MINILKKLAENKPEKFVNQMMKNPDLLSDIFKGIFSPNKTVKNRSAKILKLISEKNPQKLYSRMDFFTGLLDGDDKILKWTAMDIIANLVSVDSKNKFDKIFKKFYGFLFDKVMITAAHVVDNSWKIALAKPNLLERITKELLKVERIPRETNECKNIVIGKAINSFGVCFDSIKNNNEVISFIKRQLKNSRSGTKKKAEKFLSRLYTV